MKDNKSQIPKMRKGPTSAPARGRPPAEGEAAKGHIHLRTTMARKNAYVRAARPKGLSEWITDHLDRAAGYQADK